jgi:GT2 family glycosyltransferase
MIMQKISVIIPNWNGEKFLNGCLQSIKKNSYDNYEIIIVDNGSTDKSILSIKDEYPDVVLIKNSDNLGFATAVNQGIKLSFENQADYVLLLNNDTVVAEDFLEKMASVFADKKVGIVGAKIYYHDEPKKIWFAGGNFIKWRASGQHRYWMQNDEPALSGVMESDFITGCAMLIRKEVFQDVGYFYEPYFLGVEDLDFCYQARKRGWGIKVNLDAKIFHKVSLSRAGEFSFSNGYYGTRNRLYFAFKREKNYIAGLILLFVIVPFRIIQWTIQNRHQMLKGLMLGTKDFLLNKMGKY